MKRVYNLLTLLLVALVFPMLGNAQIYYTGSLTGWQNPASAPEAQKNDRCYYFKVSNEDQFQMSTMKADWDAGFKSNAIVPAGMRTNFVITDEAVKAQSSTSNCFAKADGYVCVSLDYKFVQLVADVADFKIPSVVVDPDPVGPQIYITGSVRGWDPGDPGLGTATVNPAGWQFSVAADEQFKVSSTKGSWEDFNSGALKPSTNGKVLTLTAEAQPTVIDGFDPNLVAPSAGYVWVSEDYSYIQFVTDLGDVKLPGGDTPVDPDPVVPSAFYLVYGNGDGWNLDGVEMTGDNGVFTATLGNVSGKYYFCFTETPGSWANIGASRYGAGNDEIEVSVDNAYDVCRNNDKCWVFTAETSYTYTLKVDFSTMKLTITAEGGNTPVDPDPDPDPVTPEDLYIVGADYGNWSADASCKMTRDGNVYTYVFENGVSGEWKIWSGKSDAASGAWLYSFGAGADQPVAGEPYDTWFNSAANFTFSSDKKTTLTFTLVEGSDVQDSSIPSILVLTVEEGGDTPVDPDPIVPEIPEALYMIGNVNSTSWALGADDAVSMTKAGSVFLANDVTIDDAGEGSGYFTFVTLTGSSWDEVNAGDRFGAEVANAPAVSGEASKVVMFAAGVDASAANSWMAEAGVYNVAVDLTAMTVTLTKQTNNGIDGAGEVAGQEAVYFNLQGMRVSNPVAGEVYVVVRGNEVRKELIK